MSLFSHNKCGKITIKHWELNLGAYYLFYILLILWYIRTQRTPAYGPANAVSHCTWTRPKISYQVVCCGAVLAWLLVWSEVQACIWPS